MRYRFAIKAQHAARVVAPYWGVSGKVVKLDSSISYSFIAILLGLCMYFGVYALFSTPEGIELHEPLSHTPRSQCEAHKISIGANFELRLNKTLLVERELLERLALYENKCSIKSFYLMVHPSAENQYVVELTSKLKSISPRSQISWHSRVQ